MSGAAGTDAAPLKGLAGSRVIFCNWRDLNHRYAGGAELYCLSIAERFAAAGAHVTLLTARDSGDERRELRRGVHVVRAGGTFSVYPLALLRLAARRRKVDFVVDCQNGIPFFSPLVLPPRVPVVCLLHHVHQKQFALYFPRPVAWVGRLLEARVSRAVYRTRPFIVVSPSTRMEARRTLRLRGPLHVVPGGMDVPSAKGGPRALTPTITVVGRLVPHKRFEALLEAIPRVRSAFPDLHVHFIGDGPDRPRLEALTDTLGIRAAVTFHGRVSNAERDERLAAGWLTVNPSVGEGWGLSIIEANAYGLPAIAFRVAGIRDAVRDGETGWLVEEGTPLAQPIITALAHLREESHAVRWRRNAIAWASGFSWDQTASRIASVLLAERDRLARDPVQGEPMERRRGSDLATRVRVHAVEGVLGKRPGRRTDLIREEAGSIDMLLFGADENDAIQALKRRGVHSDVDAAVARPLDLLGNHTPRNEASDRVDQDGANRLQPES